MVYAHLTSLCHQQQPDENGYQKVMLTYWRDLCGAYPIPLKSEFRPQQFSTYLPRLAVIEVADCSAAFRLTLIGGLVSRYLNLARGELSPMALNGGVHANTVEATLVQVFLEVMRTGQPTLARGVTRQRAYSSFPAAIFTVLVMPFAAETDRRKPRALITAFEFLPDDGEHPANLH